MAGVGTKRQRLAKLLQEAYPEHNGLKLTWHPGRIYPAQGHYRTTSQADVVRWEAIALHYKDGDSGDYFSATSVHGYNTITELVAAGKIAISENNEVYIPK